MSEKRNALMSAALAAATLDQFNHPRRIPVGTSIRQGTVVLHPVPDDVVSANAKAEVARVQNEQERIAKAKARKERRAVRRATQ